MNLTLIAYATAAALTFGAGFGACAVWKNGQISQIKLEQANDRIASQRASRVAAERRVAAQSAAQAKSANSIILSVSDRAAVDRVALGLRDTTAAVVRACADDPATCPRKAAALGVVFDRCAETAIGMGSDAQGWAIEAVRQNEAASP